MPRLSIGRAWLFAPVVALLLAAGSALAIDFNATKGVWKLLYGVTDSQIAETGANTGWLSRDDDGDGISNGSEVAAGTNPFSPGSAVKVTSITADATTVHLTFPTVTGKQYVAQSRKALTPPDAQNPDWAAGGSPVQVMGNGSPKTLDVPKGTSNFFRVLVQDVDTDGDGVSDWAEVVANLNPNAVQTTPGVNDSAYVTAQLAMPSEVVITATAPFASEDGPTPGGFTISRQQSLLPISVNVSTTGSTAVAGSNYTTLTLPVSLPIGTTSVQIPVAPIQDGLPLGSKSVKATLTAATAGATGYVIGSHNTATVIIGDATNATGSGLLGRYYDTSNGTLTRPENIGIVSTYTSTRVDSTHGTATLAYTGTGAYAVQTGHTVNIVFTGGNMNTSPYNSPANYTVASVNAGISFTINLTTSVPTAQVGPASCQFRVESVPTLPAVERVDSTVNFDWQYGTPNGGVIAPLNSPDNYSDTFETYLVPSTTGGYVFQLDADDKAQVQLDTGSGLTEIVEHNWTSPGSDPVGTFKTSGTITLTAGTHYRMLVKHVETTGDARCRLQWKVPGTTSFANIPQANQFTHTQAMTYGFSGGNVIIIPTGGHSNNVNDQVSLVFTSGVLAAPGTGAGSYTGTYTITTPVGGTGLVTVTGASIPSPASSTINVPNTAGLAVGMAVTGTGVPANEYITAVNAGAPGSITITTGAGVTQQASTTLTCTSTYTLPITPFSVSVPGAATTAGTNIITVPLASTAGLVVGMPITGTGLPGGETITAINTAATNGTTVANGIATIAVSTATGITTQASTTLTATLPATGTVTGSGFVQYNAASTTTGVFNLAYPNTTFAGSPGRIGIDSAVTAGNNGQWNSGTPDAAKIQPDTFSVRWTGQVQPQFSEEYTFLVTADDGCALYLNGQLQPLKMSPSASTTGSNYIYNATTGQVFVNYAGLAAVAGSFVAGESVRLDWSAGNLNHAPTNSPTYTYDATTNKMVVDYTNLVVGQPGGTRVAGSYAVGETVEVDPTSGSLNALSTLPYVIESISGNTFTIDAGSLNFATTVNVQKIDTGASCQITTATAHNLAVGQQVRISGVSGGTFSPTINGLFTVVTAPTTTTFTVASNCTVAPPTGSGTIAAGGTITVNDTRNCTVTGVHPSGTGTYNYDSATGSTVITYTGLAGANPGSVTSGQTIYLDPTASNLSAFAYAPYTVTAATPTTFTVTFPTGLGNVTNNQAISILDPGNATNPAAATGFSVNIGAGRYADVSTNTINVDIVSKTMKDWSSNGNERYVRIPMIGGTRYNIQLDYYEASSAARCLLSWFSPSQPKQIIPSERLYPATVAQAPAAYVAGTDASAIVGGTFSQAIAGSNGGTVSISGAPDGLTLDGNGVLTGTPTTAGDYQITITVTNASGTSTSVLNLHVAQNAGSVVHDRWDGIAGTSLASIPTTTTASFTENVSTLETNATVDNYGERLRGYFTAPATGNYYFWIAANSPAELWISNDDDTINALKRAWVTTGSTTARTWNGEANQKSPWLALEQGQKYYFEVLHKASTGSGDNLAIGWAKPGEATTSPSQVVPGYALSPYSAPASGSTPGTLYVATLLAQPNIVTPTQGVGSSTLRLSADETVAYMRYSYSNLTGAITSEHIHIDPNPGHADGEIVYDIDNPSQGGTPGDGLITNPSDPNYGAFKWTIASHGTYTGPQILDAIKSGKAYINLHTNANTNGEIRGNYTLAEGTRTFTAPPAPGSWTDDSGTDAGAVRFLSQTTFGANPADIAALKAMSATGGDALRPASRYETWIDDQFTKSATRMLPEVLAREIADVFGPFDVRVCFDSWWKTSITAQDQLRQRVAFALNQIHVVSGQGPLEDNSRAIGHFYDTLAQGVETSPGSGVYKGGAFGNFRDILQNTTLTPGMGRYLDMLGNDKPDLSVGRSPNENYAREIKQLFSIGLYRMWPDGSLMLSQSDAPIATYTQREIVGLAHVFTGWYYGYDGDFRTALNSTADWTRPMREVPARHFTGVKRLLNNEVFPGLPTLNGQTLDPYATHTSNQYTDPVYEALPAQELNAAHDMLFNHPNTGPFICRQLIQRLVTSNPSRDYLYRVVQKFNDNGSGVRGDMKTVLKAILLDYEARSTAILNVPAYGKQREPILRVANAARAFRPAGGTGTYAQTGSPLMLVTVPNQLQAGNVVFLEFTDSSGNPAPTTGTYTVLGTSSTPLAAPANPNSSAFYVASPGWMFGTYVWNNNSTVTITMNGHNIPGDNAGVIPTAQVLPAANHGRAYFDFTSNSLNGSAIDQTVSTVSTSTAYDIASGVGNSTANPPTSLNGNYSGTTFVIPGPSGGTGQTGSVMMARFSGSYSCTGRGGVITIDTVTAGGGGGTVPSGGGAGTVGTMADHNLTVGSSVFLNFVNSRDTTSGVETSTENDLVYTITGIPDPNTFTVTARDAANAAMNSDNQVAVFPSGPAPLTRNGTLVMRQSTYVMDNTDNDLAQTPLNSPTVFNFFLPDYKFAGSLASQGITTPEFQLTAQTTAVRQANFFYNGIFQPSNNTSIAGFYTTNGTGGLALVMDLAPWLGNATNSVLGDGPQNAQLWTSQSNIDTLVDRMDTLLTGGELGASTKTLIKKFLYQTGFGITLNSNPCKITLANHGFANNDSITITGVTGGTFRNSANSGNVSINQTFTVANATTNDFTLTISGGIQCTGAPTIGSAYITPSTLSYTTPTATEIANRLRAIIHLILTSPDFTIQR
jgi:uncharacterized protein (DUF1800 family)